MAACRGSLLHVQRGPALGTGKARMRCQSLLRSVKLTHLRVGGILEGVKDFLDGYHRSVLLIHRSPDDAVRLHTLTISKHILRAQRAIDDSPPYATDRRET